MWEYPAQFRIKNPKKPVRIMNSKKPVPDNEIEENLCKIVDKVRVKINDRVIELCHTYPTIMKLGTIIPYLKKTQKYMNHVTHLLSSADISIFFIGNR